MDEHAPRSSRTAPEPAAPRGPDRSVSRPPPEPCDRTVTLILALFLGTFGAHRFFTGFTTVGLLQLVTAGGCGIWWAVDVTMILAGRYRDAWGRPLA